MSAASVTNPRYDTVVAWVDTTVTTASNVNSPGSFKFKVITGAAAGSPPVLSDSEIQSNLGAGIAWVRLADVLRSAGVDNVTNANIVDRRSALTPNTPLASGAVKAANVDWTLSGGIWWEELGRATAPPSSITSLSVNVSAKRRRHYMIIANGVSATGSPYFLLRVNGIGGTDYAKMGYSVQNGGSGVTPIDTSATDCFNPITPLGATGLFNIEQTLIDTGSGWVRGLCQSSHSGYMSNTWSAWKRSGSTPIETFDLVSTVANGLGAGSEIIVLGHD